MERKSGVLMHVSSLPNKYGIGTFGTECYEFIDFLANSGQKVWEILPLNQTGFGDSPYSSCCSYSFNPYFISLDALVGMGLLKREELSGFEDNTSYVDYGKLYYTRYNLLRKAFSRFNRKDEGFKRFLKRGEYRDYALYMTLKSEYNNKAFYDWPTMFKFRDGETLTYFSRTHREDMLFWQFVQYEAREEWLSVKAYANSRGIEIIGDLPLYVAYDSVDVWVNYRFFKLDDRLVPEKVAGVPPDYFSKTGQLWGNPVYNYQALEKENFDWWAKRFSRTLKYFDYVRIDHFRGFDRFYEIDYGRADAMVGEWQQVPSDKLFARIHKSVGKKRIIAEDLGIIDDGVRALLEKQGYPGMRILSFAFNGEDDNAYLPQNIEENSICYTGTHDNDTLMSLIDHMSDWDYTNLVKGVKKSLKIFGIKKALRSKRNVARAVIELGYACKANTFIIPMQDVCLLGADYRMNTPGRDIANWTVKIPAKCFTKRYSNYLKRLTNKYGREN